MSTYPPKSIYDIKGVVYDPRSFTDGSSLIDEEILDTTDEIEDKVEIQQNAFDTKHTMGIDFSNRKAYLHSDLHAKHMTPIEDIECDFTEEFFNEMEGWQSHDDEPSLKTWTKNVDMGGRHLHCIRWKRFFPGVTGDHLTYMMCHPDVRPAWDKGVKSVWMSAETYIDKDTCKDSECAISILELATPFPLRQRYAINWSRRWAYPIPTKDGQQQKYKVIFLSRSCRHPDVVTEIQNKRKGEIAAEMMTGLAHHEDEVNGVQGCWQTSFIMADLGGQIPAWAMKLVMSPWAMKRGLSALDVALQEFRNDPPEIQKCKEYGQLLFSATFLLQQVSSLQTGEDDHNNQIGNENLFSSIHDKSQRFRRSDSSAHSAVSLKVTAKTGLPLQKSSFPKRWFHRFGSFVKRQATLVVETTPSEAETIPETPKT